METEIFKSNRYFKLFDVVVSHGQLLFRSQKDERNQCNVDIIFFDTKFIQIAQGLNGLTINIVSDKKQIEYDSVHRYLSYRNNYLFEIQSEGENYYIVASFLRVFENQLDFSETSLNYENVGRDKEIATSLGR
ncbi:MAG TPA: hypothetical protein VKR58_10890 [Aquella sp.]|nr:hypothetical protein [Aquella sp.]